MPAGLSGSIISRHRAEHGTDWRPAVCVLLFGVALASLRTVCPERPLDYVGPRAMVDAGFAMGLLVLVLLVATGLGAKVLCWLKIANISSLERAVLSAPIGLGILALGMLALGLAGWFRQGPILFWLAVATVWASPEAGKALGTALGRLHGARHSWRLASFGERAVWVAVLLLLILSLPQALMPPWDWDGLVYHLQAPRLFLDAGRMYLLPDVWTANYPLTMEMVFTFGLAAGSDTFARLIHLAMAAYLAAATYAFAQRHVGRAEAVVAAALLIGSPVLWPEAVGTYVDLAWALFEFLAIYTLSRWGTDRSWQWLALVGVFCGLSLGTKYIAIIQAGLIAAWIVWECRGEGARAILRHAFVLALPVAIIAAPWYIKNWLWGGNPVYPLAFGGAEWPTDRLQWLNVFLGSFGTGRSLADYLLLPWNIFAHSGYFGIPLSDLDWPNPLFLLAFLYPLRRRSHVTDLVAALAAARLVAWAGGVQVTRYLVAVFPALSIVTAVVLTRLTAVPLLRKLLLGTLVGVTVAIAIGYQLLFTVALPAIPVSIGLQSKHDFLVRFVPPYRLQQVIERLAPDRGRVFVLWDGRGYYRDSRYLMDTEQSRWTQWVHADANATALSTRLRSYGVTHVLFSIDDARFIIERHDPARLHLLAANFYWEEFVPECGRVLYADSSAHLIELTCS